MDEPHMITKEVYFSLFSEDITIRQQKEILDTIGKRITYLLSICAYKDASDIWWMYGPECESYSFFQAHEKGEIKISSNADIPEWVSPNYLNKLQSKWLYTPFVEWFNHEKESFKQKYEAKREKNRLKKLRKAQDAKIFAAKRPLMIATISAKLTPEELQFITFK